MLRCVFYSSSSSPSPSHSTLDPILHKSINVIRLKFTTIFFLNHQHFIFNRQKSSMESDKKPVHTISALLINLSHDENFKQKITHLPKNTKKHVLYEHTKLAFSLSIINHITCWPWTGLCLRLHNFRHYITNLYNGTSRWPINVRLFHFYFLSRWWFVCHVLHIRPCGMWQHP